MDPSLSSEIIQDEVVLTLRIPRLLLGGPQSPPATVTQRTVEHCFGMTPRTYRDMARAGLFPTKRIGRLVFARFADVLRALTEDAEARAHVEKSRARTAATGTNSRSAKRPTEAELLHEIAEAQRYVSTARSRAEVKARREELRTRAGALARQNQKTLADGSQNPDFDGRLDEHADELLLLSAGLRRKRD